ncbi:MAG: hypothetical protein RLZZ61_988 [Pseudomonadota bacterium]|jgi:hypothetical protein
MESLRVRDALAEIQYLRNKLGAYVNISLAVYHLRNIILARAGLDERALRRGCKNRS